MLRLRSSILAGLLSPTSAAPISPLHRLLSAAAPAVSPIPSFAVEEYLVDTCGLTRAQALKASTKISHLKSPTNPDATLAFLAGLGLSPADVAAVVAKDPKLLCSAVDKTLAPVVTGLTGLGMSRDEIARLVLLACERIRRRSVVSNLQYYLPIFGSFENILRPLKFNTDLITCNLERIVKPNVVVLRDCGLGARDIAKMCLAVPWLLTTNVERVQAMTAFAEGLGVPRGSGMFRHMLHAVAFLSEEKIKVKVEHLKKTFRWSDAEVSTALSKAPLLLRRSDESQRRASEFLFSEVGVEPAYLAHVPVMINYSLEGRLKPRYYAVKFLKDNGLLKRDLTYYTVAKVTEKVFIEKFIRPHEEAAPHLAQDYVAACRGEGSTNFRST